MPPTSSIPNSFQIALSLDIFGRFFQPSVKPEHPKAFNNGRGGPCGGWVQLTDFLLKAHYSVFQSRILALATRWEAQCPLPFSSAFNGFLESDRSALLLRAIHSMCKMQLSHQPQPQRSEIRSMFKSDVTSLRKVPKSCQLQLA